MVVFLSPRHRNLCVTGFETYRKEPKGFRSSLCRPIQLQHVLVPQSISFFGTGNISALQLRTERGPAKVTKNLEDYDGVPVSRQEVVDLLLLAVNALLQEENCERLRKRLGKSERHSDQRLSELPLVSSVAVEMSFVTNALEDPEIVYGSEIVERVEAPDFRNIHDEKSWTTSRDRQTSKIIPRSSISETVDSKGQSQTSLTTVSPTDDSPENSGHTSLTGIRRLNVLDVHSYVHTALRESFTRTWLRSRQVEE